MSNPTNIIATPRLAAHLFGQPIAYSRAQAIADGALVDVSHWADLTAVTGFSAAFGLPIVVTSLVWADISSSCRTGAEEWARAQDVLFAASYALKRAWAKGADEAAFQVALPVARGGKYQDYKIGTVAGDPGQGEWLIITPDLGHYP